MKSIYERFKKKALLSTLIIHMSLMSFSVTYYVSNSGNDSNSGLSPELAWKSLSKVNSFPFNAGDYILFRCGDTFKGTLSLHYRFGKLGSPITYSSYGTGSKPVISGFTTISGWTNEGNGVYSKAIVSESQTNMVLVNGTQHAMGRYPNSGTKLTYESFSTNTSITDNQLGSTINWAGAEAVVFKNPFTIDRCVITAHSGNTLTYTNQGALDNGTTNEKYFVQNDIRTLDQLGEWYHDVNAGKFYMYFGASLPTAYTVSVATVNSLLFAGSGEDYITIDKLSFMGSIKDAIAFNWQNDRINITNCDVSFAGLSGISVAGNTGTISGCNILNCNRVGIMSYITNAVITGNILQNINIFEGQGSIGQLYRGAIMTWNDKINVSNNTIENCGFNGIYPGSPTLTATLKNNVIKNSCILRVDQGAIYLSGAKTSFLIDGNIIVGSGGNGIYLDEYSTKTKVWNNTISGCYIDGIKLHKANNNSIKNNTCFDNKYGIGFENWLNERNLYNDSVIGNKFVARSSAQYSASLINWYNNNNIGYLSGNVYARPMSDSQTIHSNLMAVAANKTLEQWKTITASDANSTKSPQTIVKDDELSFFYNTSQNSLTISLPYPMIDFVGKKYSGTVTLEPFKSVVMLKDNNPVVPVLYTEYKSICEGLNYNGWTLTGKYERTLVSKSGADSIVTTYLTVNPKYSVTEDISINEGEEYNEWTTAGQYTRTLTSISGCDSIVVTNLTVNVNTGKEGQVIPTHYVPVWQGTGQNLINFTITSATIEDIPLDLNDEVAVFSGSLCVGSGKLIQSINSGNADTYLTFNASQNTGSANGYSLNDTIIFKIWDESEQQEMIVKKVNYQQTGTSLVSGRYTALATVVASIESYTEYTQTFSLKAGNNLISSYLVPENSNILVVMKSLCDNGALYKMQDESGRSLEYWGQYGGWVNKIGNLSPAEGYNVNVKFDCSFQITGRKVNLPLVISLKKGWNYISFPFSGEVSAVSVMQSLIDQKTLYKVQDETGKSIEYVKGYGWINNIGNFQPGKGYKVYVVANTSMTFQSSYTKTVSTLANIEKTEHFIPRYEGNGIAHMNINIKGLTESGLNVGDEVAAFDGEICVGAIKLTTENFNIGIASLVSSFSTDEQNQNGFLDGDAIVLKAWNKSIGEIVLGTELIDGSLLYMKNGSVLVGVDFNSFTTDAIQIGDISVSVFPSPSNGNFTVKLGENVDSGSRIEISDISGRLILARQVTEPQEQFNLSGQTPGLYLVKASVGKKMTVNKLVISR